MDAFRFIMPICQAHYHIRLAYDHAEDPVLPLYSKEVITHGCSINHAVMVDIPVADTVERIHNRRYQGCRKMPAYHIVYLP